MNRKINMQYAGFTGICCTIGLERLVQSGQQRLECLFCDLSKAICWVYYTQRFLLTVEH